MTADKQAKKAIMHLQSRILQQHCWNAGIVIRHVLHLRFEPSWDH